MNFGWTVGQKFDRDDQFFTILAEARQWWFLVGLRRRSWSGGPDERGRVFSSSLSYLLLSMILIVILYTFSYIRT